LATDAALRWNPAGWGTAWFELAIPPALQQQPQLYLHVGGQPASFLLPFVAPGSAMINLGSQYPLERNARIDALLARHRGHVRVMRQARSSGAPALAELDFALIPLGLEADLTQCQQIVLLQRPSAPRKPETRFYYTSCATRPLAWSPAQWQAYRASKLRADTLFDRLELLCPQYFQPRGLRSEGNGQMFRRLYLNTDTVLWQATSGDVNFGNELTGLAVELGQIAGLEHAVLEKNKICP
jgi:hypothetical protein